MKFLIIKILTILILSVSFEASSNFNQEEFCTPERLQNIGLNNILEYPKHNIAVGQVYELYCKRPFASISGHSVSSKFTATCLSGKRFFFSSRGCVKACDLSALLSSNKNIDFKKTHIFPNILISPVKLVPIGSRVKFYCKDGYEVEEGINHFIYECSEESERNQEDVIKCQKIKKLKFIKIPPTSNIKNNFKPELKCHTLSIVVPNGKVVGRVNSLLNAGESLTVACEAGYTATDKAFFAKLGAGIVESFKLECDKNGSGKWNGLRACVKRCNVNTIVDFKKYKNIKVELINRKGQVIGNLIHKNIKTKYLYTDIGSTIKISCPKGFVTSSTGSESFIATCLDGDNFSIGNKVPFCVKKEVMRCKNSEISVVGKLQEESLKKGYTALNKKVPFKCQGDGGEQEGKYFKNGGNKFGVPQCIRDARGGARWNSTTFNCYKGCIPKDGNPPIPEGKISAVNQKDIRRVRVADLIGSEKVLYKSKGISIEGLVEARGGEFIKLINFIYNPNAKFLIRDILDARDVIKNTRYYNYNGHKKYSPFSFIFRQKSQIYFCDTLQTEPRQITLNYDLMKLSLNLFLQHNPIGNSKNLKRIERYQNSPQFRLGLQNILKRFYERYLEDYETKFKQEEEALQRTQFSIKKYTPYLEFHPFISWLDYSGDVDKCQNSQNSPNGCFNKIVADYNYKGNKLEYLELPANLNLNSLNQKQLCREVFKALIKKPNHQNCKGSINIKIPHLDEKIKEFQEEQLLIKKQYYASYKAELYNAIEEQFEKEERQFLKTLSLPEKRYCGHLSQVPIAIENVLCEVEGSKFIDAKRWIDDEVEIDEEERIKQFWN